MSSSVAQGKQVVNQKASKVAWCLWSNKNLEEMEVELSGEVRSTLNGNWVVGWDTALVWAQSIE